MTLKHKNHKKSQRFFSLFLHLIVFVGLFSSCVPQRSIVLMQDQNKDNQTVFPALEHITDRYTIQPNDYLYINVASPDPKLSIFFNPQAMSQSGSSQTYNQKYFYYMVDDSSQIDFPLVGKIDLKGCTIRQARERISDAVSEYLSDYTITVRLTSNSFTVLGEVSNQSVYTMDRDQITLYEAIAQAGGFTQYAKRKEVKLLRKNPNGELEEHIIDMRGDNIINSDLYYVYPNDVIYVRPMFVKMFGFGETLSVSLVTSLITLYLLVISL